MPVGGESELYEIWNMLMRVRTLRRQYALVSMEDWDVLRFQGVLMRGRAVEGFWCARRIIRAVKGSQCESARLLAVEDLKQTEIRNRNM